MSGLNGFSTGNGSARLLRRLEATYLRLVDPPLAIPRPRLEMWVCEPAEAGATEAVNEATGEVRSVAALEAVPDAPGVITVLVKFVDDRPIESPCGPVRGPRGLGGLRDVGRYLPGPAGAS